MRNKLLLIWVVSILISEALLTGLIPHCRGYLFDLLSAKEGPIYLALGIYYLNYFSLDFFQSIKAYYILKLALRYRTKRTEEVITKDINSEVSNIPQRIQEDIKLSYTSRITVWSEYFISGIIVLQLLYINADQPKLVIAALVYAAVSVAIAYLFNPRLTRAEKIVQEQEAEYRSTLMTRITDITGLGSANKASIFAGKIRLQYLLFTKLQLGVMSVLPYVVMIPGLMQGDYTLGDLVKHQASFSLIVVNAAILIQYYTLLVQGKASNERVQEIENDK